MIVLGQALHANIRLGYISSVHPPAHLSLSTSDEEKKFWHRYLVKQEHILQSFNDSFLSIFTAHKKVHTTRSS
jgi:hypothetical protein